MTRVRLIIKIRKKLRNRLSWISKRYMIIDSELDLLKNIIEDPKNGKDYEKLQEATVKMSNLELEYLTLIEEEERLKLQLDG